MPGSIGPVGHDFKLSISDNITSSDTISKKPTRTFSDGIDISESYARTITAIRAFSDGINVTDTIAKLVSRPFTDNITILDTIGKDIQRAFSDGIDITDSFASLVAIFKELSDSLNMSDSITRQPTKGLTDGIDISDSYARVLTLLRDYSDSIGVSDTIGKLPSRQLTDSIDISDTISKMPVKGLTDTIDLEDTFARVWDSTPTFTENITMDDDIFPQIIHQDIITDIQTDFSTVLADLLTEDVTLRQVAVTVDSLGNPATATNTDVTVQVGIKYLTETDRQLIGAGTAIRGELVGYFKDTYTVASVDYTVTVGDIIIRDSVYYRITKLFGQFTLGDTVIYIKGLLERL